MNIYLNKKEIEILKDLEKRLVDNYNNGKKFEQQEEDRLVIGNILDKASKAEKHTK